MKRILKWCSATTLVLITAIFITSCASTGSKKEEMKSKRELEADTIARELGKKTADQKEREKAVKKAKIAADKKAAKKAAADKKAREKEAKRLAKMDVPMCTLEIKTDKASYMQGEPVAVTLSYKNNSKARIRLVADGHAVTEGFSGELIVIKRKDFEDPYSFLPGDLKVEEHVVYPGETWTRTIKDVSALLVKEGVVPHRQPKEIDENSEREKALSILDLPRFEKADKYTLQVVYYPNRMVKEVDPKDKKKKPAKSYSGPRIVDMKVLSNVLSVQIKRK